MNGGTPDQITGLLTETAEVAGYIYSKGWAESSAGNISVNTGHLLDDELSVLKPHSKGSFDRAYPAIAGNTLMVSGSGRRMRDIAVKPIENLAFIKIGESGRDYEIMLVKEALLQEFMPTSELPTHLAVHNEYAAKGIDESTVLHCHVSEFIVLTQNPLYKTREALNKLLYGVHPEMAMFLKNGIGYVPFELPGSQDIASTTLDVMAGSDIVVWEKHGVLATGRSPAHAYDKIEIAAQAASVYFMCRAAGFEPEGLTEKQLEGLRKVGIML